MIWSFNIKRFFFYLILLGIIGFGLFFSYKKGYLSFLNKPAPPPPPKTTVKVKPPQIDPVKSAPKETVSSSSVSISDIRKELLAHLEKGSDSKNKILKIPKKKKAKPKKWKKRRKRKTKVLDKRAKGRKERAKLPLGVVLWDGVRVFKDETGYDVRYTMGTGDFLRVFSTPTKSTRKKIQPGVDLYLAATSKQFEAAGSRFPDIPGWVETNDIHVFEPSQAIEFTQETTPMTLGRDSSFSTVGFYERALKNPDPVVHRVIGPRFIELLSVHEDYSSSWGKLYRDSDSKIRSVTLAALRERGVSHSRQLIEDLIRRVAELTTRRVHGAEEAEVLTILNLLKNSGHPRVPFALQSFSETWATSQNKPLVNALNEILAQP
ncbi:hypothetical protein BVX98_02390 [bacterium F11]|nr:hypothetical protein BVX98_02390 [bacterium F11]